MMNYYSPAETPAFPKHVCESALFENVLSLCGSFKCFFMKWGVVEARNCAFLWQKQNKTKTSIRLTPAISEHSSNGHQGRKK